MRADDSLLTPLNFDPQAVDVSLIDKHTGLEVTLGRFSGLPARHERLMHYNRGVGISLQARGLPQKILDAACKTLIEEAHAHRLDLLITRSDMPFDARWYWLGQIMPLLSLAQQRRLGVPISPLLFDEITQGLPA